jgi:hypothetical protein
MKYSSVDHFFQDATNKLKLAMSPEDLEEVKNTKDVIEIQHTFGKGVVNYFGLWNVNKHLGDPTLVAIKFTEYFKGKL